MRRAIGLVLLSLAACGGRTAPTDPPHNVVASAPTVVDKATLGGLVLIPFIGENNATFAPTSDVFALDTNNIAKPGSTWSLVGSGGERATINADKASAVPYGCDNSLEGTLLASKEERLPAGVAWMHAVDATWQPTAIKIERGPYEKTRESYKIGPITVKLEKVAKSKGVASVEVGGRTAQFYAFERVIMDGAEPTLENLDFSDPDFKLQIPVPVAAWAISTNGPYLLVTHTQGFEGATLEAFVIEVAPLRASKIEPMTVYLYQCAF